MTEKEDLELRLKEAEEKILDTAVNFDLVGHFSRELARCRRLLAESEKEVNLPPKCPECGGTTLEYYFSERADAKSERRGSRILCTNSVCSYKSPLGAPEDGFLEAWETHSALNSSLKCPWCHAYQIVMIKRPVYWQTHCETVINGFLCGSSGPERETEQESKLPHIEGEE